MILPVNSVGVVHNTNYDTVSLKTAWGIDFVAEMQSGTALSFAQSQFTTSEITLLDLTRPNPQVEIVQYPSGR